MEIKDWRSFFASKILQRGEAYFEDGAVEDLYWDGETLSASVEGSDIYDVKIAVRNGKIVRMKCDCPYAADGSAYCKHMAAVLLAAEEDADLEKQEAAPGRNTDDAKLESAVESLSADAARELLLRLGRQFREVENAILLSTSGSVPQKQVMDWMRQPERLTARYAGRHGFIDYENASEYVQELSALLEEAVPQLVDSGLVMDAFHLVCKAFAEATEVDMDDSNGELTELYEYCTDEWTMIYESATPAERRKIYEWFLANYDNGKWSMGEDILRDFLFLEIEDAEFLQRNLDLLDRKLEQLENKPDSYLTQEYLKYRIHTMDKLSLPAEERERFMRRYYTFSSIRKSLVDAAIDAKNYTEAIRILRESKSLDSNKIGLVSQYSERLIQLYRQLGQTEELREELLWQITECYQRNLEYVSQLKELTPPEAWPDLREKLLQMGKMASVSRQLMLQEGMFRRLLDSILRSGSVYEMDQFSKELRKQYPEEVLRFYLSYLRREMEHASDRKTYAELAARLGKLKTYPNGEAEAAKLAQEWRESYARRRAMLEELKNAGF